MQDILVPISPGELLDKITILRIKSRRMTDEPKLRNVRAELEQLERTWRASGCARPEVVSDEVALTRVNTELWDIEDQIRAKELANSFDAGFISLARAVYVTNDERAAIKKRVNVLLGSRIVEEKSYQPYRPADR